jgi:hypothetical protein
MSCWKKWAARTLPFLWEYVPSTVLFHAQHNRINHRLTTETMSDGLQIIGRWPQEPSDTIADASPCLRRRWGRKFYLVAREIASAAAWRKDDVGLELLFSWRCFREGDEWDDWPPTASNRFNEQSRGRGSIGRRNNQLGWRRWRGETQQLFIRARGQFEAIDSRSWPPNTTTNSRTNRLWQRTNEGQNEKQNQLKTNNNQPKKVEANLIAVLCLLVFIVIILILSPNFTSNSTII